MQNTTPAATHFDDITEIAHQYLRAGRDHGHDAQVDVLRNVLSPYLEGEGWTESGKMMIWNNALKRARREGAPSGRYLGRA